MLIVEDGSIVTGANTYVTLAEVKTYADARGLTYPDDTQLEKNIILSTDYLQSLCYQGMQVEPTVQPLKWPREDVWIYGVELPSDSIPNDLKNAQIEAALAQGSQSLLNDGSDTGENIKKEKTDMIETEYFDGGKSSVFKSERVNSYLQKFLESRILKRV